MAYVQYQVIIMSLFAGLISLSLSTVVHGSTNSFYVSSITMASAVTAASVASLLLSFLISTIVVWSFHRGINPDNISAPVASRKVSPEIFDI